MERRTLRSVEFRKEREATWEALDALVGAAEARGIGALPPSEVMRLPVLYRATLSSLSVARAISIDRNVVEYLNNLCARAYILVYAPKRTFRETAAEFVRLGFPSAVRRLRRPIALSALFMLLGAIAGFALTTADPENHYALVGEGYAQGRTPAASTEYLREGLYDEDPPEQGWLALFATRLFTHNARIGMLAFFLGVFLGVPAFLLLFANGLILGAFAALYHMRGLSVDLWGWLLPHGVTEIAAVILCGGAGLALGGALVFPGRRTRLANLAHRGKAAGAVVLGAVGMFLIAGLIEGVFRQTVLNVTVRYGLAITTAAVWLVYFPLAGRRSA